MDKKEIYKGILYSLSVIKLFNSEESEKIYHKIIKGTNKEELIQMAKDELCVEWAGLDKYGYVK